MEIDCRLEPLPAADPRHPDPAVDALRMAVVGLEDDRVHDPPQVLHHHPRHPSDRFQPAPDGPSVPALPRLRRPRPADIVLQPRRAFPCRPRAGRLQAAVAQRPERTPLPAVHLPRTGLPGVSGSREPGVPSASGASRAPADGPCPPHRPAPSPRGTCRTRSSPRRREPSPAWR